MSLEHQLHFEIARCSLCALAGGKQYCAPTLAGNPDFFLVLESPDKMSSEENNAWRHSAATMLKQALEYAHGPSLMDFHLSFLLKCHTKQEGKKPPGLKVLRECARTCSFNYLHQELLFFKPKAVILFGNLSAETFLPDEVPPVDSPEGRTFHLLSYETVVHTFPSVHSVFAPGKICSEESRKALIRLNAITGGELNLPEKEQVVDLFGIMDE